MVVIYLEVILKKTLLMFEFFIPAGILGDFSFCFGVNAFTDKMNLLPPHLKDFLNFLITSLFL